MKIRLIIISSLLLIGAGIYYFEKPNSNSNLISNESQIHSSNASTTSLGEETIKKKIQPTALDLAALPKSWKLYTYKNFQIGFPIEPQITASNSDSKIQDTTYVATEENGTAYFLTVTTLPKEILTYDSRDLLGNTVMTTVKNVNGKLAGAIDTRNATGLDSIDFAIDIPDGPRTYMGRNVLDGDTLYEMRVVYLNSKSGEFRGFVDSLKVQ